jgi:hypothetical protein
MIGGGGCRPMNRSPLQFLPTVLILLGTVVVLMAVSGRLPASMRYWAMVPVLAGLLLRGFLMRKRG